MWSFQKPSPEALQRFVQLQAQGDYSYRDVGATESGPPAPYIVDHTRVVLGQGEATFLKAQAALQGWRQLALGWISAWPPHAPLQAGEPVATVVRTLGLWWVNVCRIVYTFDHDDGSVRRFGFAYGTLRGHAEKGEERFQIEWNCATNDVTYDILAFSRPQRWYAWLGFPFVRRLQRRFARDSAAAMARLANTP